MVSPFRELAGAAGAGVWTSERLGDLRIAIDRSPEPDLTDDEELVIDRAWLEMVAENPRLFDGPYLSVQRFDPDTATLHCAIDQYRRLAVRHKLGDDTPGKPPELASVIGALRAVDADDTPHLLLGRRNQNTRTFGGLWELAPAGGIEPDLVPDAPVYTLDDLLEQVRDELPEETGLPRDLAFSRVCPAALLRVPEAHSYDVAMTIHTEVPVEALDELRGPGNWEYDELRWLSLTEAPAFDATHEREMIPQFRAFLRVIGWVQAA